MNIYLIGFMGSGKSSTGRKIASSLRWSFADTDRLVEESHSMSVPEIFTLRGETYFRDAEREALLSVASRSHLVVACGGGTPCSAENIDIMKKSGVVVYLKLPVAALVKRLEKSKNPRPLIEAHKGDGLTARVIELLDQRSQWYEQADIVADGLNATVDELTGELAAYIRSSGSYL